ncbi:MAG: YdcF family protein [Clostridia bacterium]|nr:YdcF family protein [Clostridia bacterium]
MKKIKYILISLLAVLLIYISANIFSICQYAKINKTQPAAVAIILGAAAYDGNPSPVFEERIKHSIRLYKDGYVKKLIFTGGYSNNNVMSEAETAKKYAEENGVPHYDILTENRSKITQENLRFAYEIMKENNLKTALIVSDPLHMKRAMLLAEGIGITAFSSPTETTKYQTIKTKLPFLARETFFYIGYKIYKIIS